MTDNTYIFSNHAQAYWDKGLPVIPLLYRDKKPAISGWSIFANALPDHNQQRNWLQHHADGNIGIVLGPQSNLMVIDIDSDDETIKKAIFDVLSPWESPWARIGKKGAVLAYRYNGLRTFRIRAQGEKSTIVECLSEKSQVVLPPSVHPETQAPYVANCDLLDVIDDLPTLPNDIEILLRQALEDVGVELKQAGPVQLTEKVKHGGRDSSMIEVAGHYAHGIIKGEVTLHVALSRLRGWYKAECETISGDEIDIEKGCQRLIEFMINDVTKGRQLPDGWNEGLNENLLAEIQGQLPEFAKYSWTEFGLRDRFVDLMNGEYRWSYNSEWLAFNGSEWSIDDSMNVEYLAETAIMDAYEAAHKIPEPTNRKKYIRKASSWQTNRTIKEIIDGAKSGSGGQVSPDQFDQNPYLFNTCSGTLDLSTGKCRDHDKSDFLTHCVEVVFDPEADCPLFKSFIKRLFDGDDELVSFTQTVFGLAMIGKQLEKILVIIHGQGDTGKTVLLQIMERIFGSYAQATPPSLFMEHRNEPHSERFAKLKGIRLLTTSEMSQHKKFDNEVTKRLTGGDTLEGRFMGKNSFTMIPAFTVVMAANDLPKFDGTDKAMRNRLRLIPVGTPLPKGEIDVNLLEKLEAEASGILNWVLEGALRYQSEGLSCPNKVKVATDDYGDDNDRVGQFMEEWIIMEEEAIALTEDLHDYYVTWCREEGYQPLHKPNFGKEIKKHGPFESTTVRAEGKQYRAWKGLRVMSSDERAIKSGAKVIERDVKSLNSFVPRYKYKTAH